MAFMERYTESTPAARKVKKRNFETTIPSLPGDFDATTGLELISNSASDGRVKSCKKRRVEKVTGKRPAHDVCLEQNEGKELHKEKKKGRKIGKRAVKDRELNAEVPRRADSKASDADPTNRESSKRLGFNNEKSEILMEALERCTAPIGDDKLAKETKNERKAKRREAAEAAQGAAGSGPSPLLNDIPVSGVEQIQLRKSKNKNKEKKREDVHANGAPEEVEGKPPRFTVFIGNLPFSTTTESLRKHFAAIHPTSIRHLTRKDEPEKSKGYAFLEFDRFNHMKACLKSFHHSMFDDGVSAPRKVNVELTAGGGGNKRNRHTKISEKNQRLSKERLRRTHEEKKAKLGKRNLVDHDDVHPSRRSRVPDIS